MSKFTILGYPRSGANWLRYIIQRLLNDDAPVDIIKANSSSVCVKTHRANDIKYPTTVILILRDLKESISSHILRCSYGKEYRPLATIEKVDVVEKEARWHLETLKAFDAIREPKLVVYYEDLLMFPSETITHIGDFIGCEKEDVESFVLNIKDHNAMMVKRYNDYHGKYSSGEIGFYGQHITQEAVDAMKKVFSCEVARKYMGRYGL